MKPSMRPTLAFAILCAASSSSVFAQTPTDRFVGTWLGTITTPAMRLRLTLSVARDASGGLTGSMTSVDQGGAQMAATLTLRGDTLLVAMPAANASYSAVVVGDSLKGSFTQGGSIPMNMGRAAAAPVVAHPQEPKGPFPYATEDVTFESVPGVRLAGTVVMPAGAGPFPA